MSNRRFVLKGQESKTVIGMVQDCIERGMVSTDDEVEQMESIISLATNEFEEIRNDVEVEMNIQLRTSKEATQNPDSIGRGDLVIYHSNYPKQKEFYTITKVEETDGEVRAYFGDGEWMPAKELTLVCKAKDRHDSVIGDGVEGYKNPEMSPDYIAYILRINDYKDDGWDFHRNPDGKLYAFNPAFGSHIFHSELEFKEWLFTK